MVAKLSLRGREESRDVRSSRGHQCKNSLSVSVHVECASHGAIEVGESHEHVVSTWPDMQTMRHETRVNGEENLFVGMGGSSTDQERREGGSEVTEERENERNLLFCSKK